jgi:hypothetical protein
MKLNDINSVWQLHYSVVAIQNPPNQDNNPIKSPLKARARPGAEIARQRPELRSVNEENERRTGGALITIILANASCFGRSGLRNLAAYKGWIMGVG